MISKEEFKTLVDKIREKLDETTSALISEEIVETLSAYNNGFDDYESIKIDNERLKDENDELLKVNGKLYQRIGFTDKEEKDKEEKDKEEDASEEIKIEDVIDEKGDLI